MKRMHCRPLAALAGALDLKPKLKVAYTVDRRLPDAGRAVAGGVQNEAVQRLVPSSLLPVN